MKTGKTLPFNGLRLSTTLLLMAFLLSNCQNNPVEVPTKDEFTKEKREALGDMISKEICNDFEILPDAEPYDSLHWYVQTLYNQATSIMRLDKNSPVDNRWHSDREWTVKVINDDDMVHAFALPGGDLFISTGMLKNFEREHELFYLLTFEAAMMNEGHLLNRLIEEYNSLTIKNIIEGRTTGNEITLADLATDLPNLAYESEIVKTLDKITVGSICETSILEPSGINQALLNAAFQSSAWLGTRPSYGDRPSKILDFAHENAGDCGGSTGMGNYQRFVLDVLNP